ESRGAAQRTDVVQPDAELLGIEATPTEYIASVRYSGTVRERADGPAEPFVEVWNRVKPTDGSGGWSLAGVQLVEVTYGRRPARVRPAPDKAGRRAERRLAARPRPLARHRCRWQTGTRRAG